MRLKMIPALLLMAVFVTTMPSPAVSQSKKASSDDVALELIGQVINPLPTTSVQYGYLSYVNGIDASIFSGAAHDETTALFTFYNDTTNTQVINNGPFRVVNRVGTSTIYLNAAPNGDFTNPNSFRNGMPVMTAAIRMQVIIDNVAGIFTATFVLTITSSEVFRLGNENLHLGRIGQKLRLTFLGHVNTSAPPAAHIAGFVVGGDLTK